MYKQILEELFKRNGNVIFDPDFRMKLGQDIINILNKGTNLDDKDLDMLGDILHIGNIVYNNMNLDDDYQVIENGVYDILLERYRMYRTPQVGAEPIHFENMKIDRVNKLDRIPFVTMLPRMENALFRDDLLVPFFPKREDMIKPFVKFRGYETGKKYRTISHGSPALVGTLDKCKYVTDRESIDNGTYNDPSVKIFERDFFADHLIKGIIDRHFIELALELKYDGMSVVVHIKDKMVVHAYSRGDTGTDTTTDLTPILYGYRFPRLNIEGEFKLKCEAVMTYSDLYFYNKAKNKDYKNCRSAIIGLFGSNDGYAYQDYITLVPLQLDQEDDSWVYPHLNRIEELEFLNKYFVTKEFIRYTYVSGTFETVLYLVKKFVNEAEYVRSIMPTMYDGVVVSYVNENIRKTLGRENFVNKYSVAIKFNTMKKLTTLTGITYTVGQNGQVTPMAHYTPIEFLGTIHTKSSIASVKRFNENRFKIGNIVEVEYRNDVMPYLTTPDLEDNDNNPNPILEFIKHCPECGTELLFSESGKSAICPNIRCKGRVVARMANMMDKLGLKDFAEATMEKLYAEYGIDNLVKLIMVPDNVYEVIGEVNATKLKQRLKEIVDKEMFDYVFVGSLGFSNIAIETWKKILNVYDISEIIMMHTLNADLKNQLTRIKGIGISTAETIESEIDIFMNDLIFIASLDNVIKTKGIVNKGLQIRCTGVRDEALFSLLNQMGHDASDKSVTKSTDILLVPFEGFTSSKTSKASEKCRIIPINDFRENIDYYLNKDV